MLRQGSGAQLPLEARQDGDAVGTPEDAGMAVAPNPRANAGANTIGGESKGGTTKTPRDR